MITDGFGSLIPYAIHVPQGHGFGGTTALKAKCKFAYEWIAPSQLSNIPKGVPQVIYLESDEAECTLSFLAGY